MSTEAVTENRSTCPSCGASVRQDVPWCLQCYASLHPAPATEEPSAADVSPASAADVPPTATAPTGLVPGADDQLTPEQRAEVDRVADELLAQLARQDRRTSTVRLPESAAARTALGVLLAAVAGLGLLAVLAVIGTLV